MQRLWQHCKPVMLVGLVIVAGQVALCAMVLRWIALLSAAEADSLGRAGGVAAAFHASHRCGARGVLGAAVQRVGAWQC